MAIQSRTGRENEFGRVKFGYYRNGDFYPGSSGSTPISGNHDTTTVYVDINPSAVYPDAMYRWTGSAYTMIGPPSIKVVWHDE